MGVVSVHLEDVTGQRDGRLLALEQFRKPGQGWFVRARCDCGKVRLVRRTAWGRGGGVASCGCWAREVYAMRRGS